MILPEETVSAPTVYRIKTAKGTMACASLRPGDFVKVPNLGESVGSTLCILINSSKLGRVVAFWCNTGEEVSWTYATIVGGGVAKWPSFHFLGRGKRRAYWKFLPKWIKKRVCEWKAPKP